jgi:hypothetical protein
MAAVAAGHLGSACGADIPFCCFCFRFFPEAPIAGLTVFSVETGLAVVRVAVFELVALFELPSHFLGVDEFDGCV